MSGRRERLRFLESGAVAFAISLARNWHAWPNSQQRLTEYRRVVVNSAKPPALALGPRKADRERCPVKGAPTPHRESQKAASATKTGGRAVAASCLSGQDYAACCASPSTTGLSMDGSQPFPASSCSARCAMTCFLRPAIGRATSSPAPSRTASRIRSLLTRPR